MDLGRLKTLRLTPEIAARCVERGPLVVVLSAAGCKGILIAHQHKRWTMDHSQRRSRIGPRYDCFLLTDESLGPRVIHHFEYGSFQRHIVVPRRMHGQRP